jgi:purine catabolism regulator
VAITVHELVEQPHLRLEILGGASGLGRVVTWAHSSDLDDPWGWLSGGELLMKNGRTLPHDEEGQVAFIEGLASASASACVIGSDPDSPPVSERALRRADELAIPILQVPYSMSFIVLSRAVADALLHEEASRIACTERIYDTIHAAVVSDEPKEFLARLQAELNCELFVVDAETLETILDGTRPTSVALRDRIRHEITLRDGNIPGTLRLSDQRRGEVIVVEVPYEEPTLLVASFSKKLPRDVVLLQHAATAVAVEVAHDSLRADHQRQIGSELLARLLAGSINVDASSAQLLQHHLSSVTTRVLVIAGTDAIQERRLHVGLRRRHVAHLLLRRESMLFLLTNADINRASSSLDAGVVGSLIERLLLSCTIGVSDPLKNAGRAPAAMREALWALAGTSPTTPLMNYEKAMPLPMLQSQEGAQALVQGELGVLLDYDAANGSELVSTLSVFLATQRSWQRSAETLHVHRQTVIYRIRRVEQLTGRNLSETADIAVLWLALFAYDILRLSETTQSRAR